MQKSIQTLASLLNNALLKEKFPLEDTPEDCKIPDFLYKDGFELAS